MAESGGVVQCFQAQQRCQGGRWSECGSEGSRTLTSFRVPEASGGKPARPKFGVLSYSSPSQASSDCATNVCNPYCWGFDEDPAGVLQAAGDVAFLGSASEWGNTPAGFRAKQDCGSDGGCASGYPKNCNGTPTHYNQFDGCLADHHCDTSTSECVRSNAGFTYDATTCPGVDLTIGPWCREYDGSTVVSDGFPICNRGNTAVPSGTTIGIAVQDGNWLGFDCASLDFSAATKCSHTLAQDLEPGQCDRVTSCAVSGNAVAFVNWDGAVAECGSPPPSPLTSATAPGCSNNWSDIKPGTNACAAFLNETLVEVQDYVAVCGEATGPVWSIFTFEGEAPCDAGSCTSDDSMAIRFEVQTAPLSDPTAFSPKQTLAEAPNPPFSYPARCTTAAEVPGCPINLYAALGESEAKNEVLRLTITLESSQNPAVAPALDRWQVSYSCLPNE